MTIKGETKAKLVLQDGSVFHGFSFGSKKSSSGEVVFNTGMTGYPESITDPSYKGQILTFTYPLIGNYGVPQDKVVNGLSQTLESDRIHLQGIVVSDYCEDFNHWEASKSLGSWMESQKIPGIYGVDTRALTQKLRERGVMLGKIIVDREIPTYDPNKENQVAKASVNKTFNYGKGKKTIVAIDLGMKHNIIRSFVKRNFKFIRVPWDHDFLDMKFDGLFISNGPGDPSFCKQTVENVQRALKDSVPTFGICMGNQILALAAGAKTYKLKYGHRSQNQPCLEVGTKKCIITSQNHGFAVKNIPKGWKSWFVNANDNTNEGIKHESKPFFSVQFHPEASPGPSDADYLFDKFLEELRG